MATATPRKPKLGELIHYTPGLAANGKQLDDDNCAPAHVLEVRKNEVDGAGEVVGRDVERLDTVKFQTIDHEYLGAGNQVYYKTVGREHSADRHGGTWHYPEECDS